MRTEIPNPCSLFDECLQHQEKMLDAPNQLTIPKLQGALRSLVSLLRSHERERVMKIMDQI